MNTLPISSHTQDFLLYVTPNGQVRVEILLHNQNLWLTQAQIASLFGIQVPGISKHLSRIFLDRELDEHAVISILETTANDGKTYKTKYYNLDAIISVGYRVNSRNATLFRIWATERLKEYIIKGFTMDDERLKNPNQPFGKDYFDEQLARIRDIRSSERRFYQKITDIYAKCSSDYEPNSEMTQDFFATVQNKLHFAATGQTAAEIIHSRANRNKKNMGLSTWKNAPEGMIRKADISVAKNYLTETELDQLNRIVTMYLDFAEFQAQNRRAMTMEDWIKKLDAFLQFNEQDILTHAGKISHEVAIALAEREYDQFHDEQIKLSDSLDGELEKVIKKISAKKTSLEKRPSPKSKK